MKSQAEMMLNNPDLMMSKAGDLIENSGTIENVKKALIEKGAD